MATPAVLPNPLQGAGTNPLSSGGGAATPAIPMGATPGQTPIAAGQANPFMPAGAVPVASAVPAGTTQNVNPGAVAQTNDINWNGGSNTVTGDFQATYGQGTGTAITDVLKNLGTSTDAAVAATNANVNLEAGKQAANITSGEAASGVTANSSTAALAQGDFYAGVNSQLQSTDANMELNEENTLLSVLTGEGEAHGPDTSWMDTLGNVLSGSQSAIGAASGGTELNGSSVPGGSGGNSMSPATMLELAAMA
jgi:hypothetical protein